MAFNNLYDAPTGVVRPAEMRDTVLATLLTSDTLRADLMRAIKVISNIPLAGKKLLLGQKNYNVTRSAAVPADLDGVFASNTENKMRLTHTELKPTLMTVRQLTHYTEVLGMEWFAGIEDWQNQDIADLTQNRDFQTLLLADNMEAMGRDFFKLAFLGDKLAALTSGGGYVKSGTLSDGVKQTLKDWNQIDGWFTQARASVTNRVNMTQNDELAYADQIGTMSPAALKAYIDQAIDAAPISLRAGQTADANDTPRLYCTWNVFGLMEKAYTDKMFENMQEFSRLQDGVSGLRYRGFDFFPVAALDYAIATGTKSVEVGATDAVYKPWQFMLARPSSLIMAEPANNSVAASVFFDRTTQFTILDAKYAVDFKLVKTDEIVFAD